MDLKIISSNIRFQNPADTIHDWNHRKKFLTELLCNEEPDIICTQEGRRPQLEELNTLLINNELISHHRDWIEERMYPCIYINKDKFFVEESGDIWLSETPQVAGSKSFNSAFPRLCTWAKLAIKESGREIFVVNCHLDHCFSETRAEQIKVLLNEVYKVNSSNEALILCGDFNESPEGIVRETLMSLRPNLYDPWLEKNIPEETTFHKFKGKLETGSRIDWIITDKRFSCEEIKILKDHKEGLYPSDHFPVVASLKI